MKRNSPFAQIITLLESQGIEVYTTDTREEPTWLYFTKNDMIGYIKTSNFYGFEITTVNVPSEKYGTGVLIFRGGNPPLEIFYKAMLADCWLKEPGLKYKNWQEFVKAKERMRQEVVKVILESYENIER